MIDLGINLFQEIAALGGGGGYPITNSLRFNDNDSAYLSRTPASAGNRKTWTWSGWVKRGNLGNVTLFDGGNTGPLCVLQFYDDQLRIYISNSDITASEIPITTAVFRDPSGWYHVVCVLDTTEASAANRVKFYVNGIRQTVTGLTGTIVGLNSDLGINRAVTTNIGVYSYGSSAYFDGYMAEVNFIDGQALTADDFGEINEDTGEWSPKKYSGTYGTNGFYLAFEDGAALGDDTSGNTNDWTPTNLASTDQMLDTPTNNFATLNPLSVGTNCSPTPMILQEGNLEGFYNRSTSGGTWGIGTIGIPNSGKWYSEVTVISFDSGLPTLGIASVIQNSSIATIQNSRSYNPNNGYKVSTNGSGSVVVNTPYGSTSTAGDVIGIAVDMDAGEIEFYKNNVSQGVAFTDLITSGIDWTFLLGGNAGNFSTSVFNFGQDSSFAGSKTRQGNTDANGIGDFYYTPPTGYLALCTENTGGDPIADIT